MLKDGKIHVREDTKILADSGFSGIHKLHKNSEIPHKSTRYNKITKEQKKENRKLAVQRIAVEHINRMVKIFLILKNQYRNKQKRFGLRVNLIAAICNKNGESQTAC